MASDLTPVSIAAPGFFGLNTQDSPIGLPPEYALSANNCIIDKLGRIGARKGWALSGSALAGTGEITMIHEVVSADGVSRLIGVRGTEVLEQTSSTAWVSIYSGTWATSGVHWKAVTFNNYAWLFARGQKPLRYTPGVNGAIGTVERIEDTSGYSGTVQEANEVLSAYGRLWTADTATDKVTIKWSDTLLGHQWTGGESGSLTIEKVLTNSTRPIVALAAFNGNLVIFCDTSIMVYAGADVTPSTSLNLIEVLDGVGCAARDSIQEVGSDIFFLSGTGVRSLGRIITEKSAPLYDVSRNVRDTMLEDVVLVDKTKIRSVYNDLEGFYLLSLPGINKSYCFDLKNRLENNVCRITTWSLAPTAMALITDKSMVMALGDVFGTYGGYTDNTVPYRMDYLTSWLPGSSPTQVKILKGARMILVNGSGYDITLSWGFDYQGFSSQLTKNIPTRPPPSEYNIAEYGIGVYGGVSDIFVVNTPLSGFGQVFQFGINTVINDEALSIQQIDIFSKIGRLA